MLSTPAILANLLNYKYKLHYIDLVLSTLPHRMDYAFASQLIWEGVLIESRQCN